MATKKIVHFMEVYTITAPDGKTQAVFVPKKGGVCSSIVMPHGNKQRELLFLQDYFWQEQLPDLPGGLPFLFPVCARVERNGQLGNYLYDGHIYQMPMHGFAWRSQWEVIEHKADELTMCLRDTPTTRAIYPFSFEVKLTYKVSFGLLICKQIYTNRGQRPMPYYAGFHPYFLTPLPGRGKERILLEYQPTKRLHYNENFTDISGEQELFSLPVSIIQPEINEALTELAENKTIKLNFPEGFIIYMKAEGNEDLNLFPYVQLHTAPKKSFFCVEPWMGFPNAINSVQGVRWLQPGQSECGILTLSIELKEEKQ